MKLEVIFSAISALIAIAFVLTRNAYLMGAMVFVATPLFVVALIYYGRRVFVELRQNRLL